MDNQGIVVPFLAGSRDFNLVQSTETSTGATWLYIDWVLDVLCLDIKLKLSTHLHLAPRLRKIGDTPPFPFVVCRQATSTLYFILLTITEFLQCAYRLWHMMIIFINICALKNVRSILTHLFTLDIISFMYWLLFDCCNIHPSFLLLNKLNKINMYDNTHKLISVLL